MIDYNRIPESKRGLVKLLIADLVVELKPEVAKIEASPATTKAHYGRYMTLLSGLTGYKREVMALALIEAGANTEGIAWAFKLTGGAYE